MSDGKPNLTDRQRELIKRREDEQRNRHTYEPTRYRGRERCDICGHPQDHPYHR